MKLIGSLTGLAVLSSFGPSCMPNTSRPEPLATPGLTPGSSVARPSKHDVMDTLGNAVPTDIKNAFPPNATITLQHKQLTLEQVKSIEAESGADVPAGDFHSFVARAPSGRIIGTATISEIRDRSIRSKVLLVLTPNFRIKKVTALGELRVESRFLNQFTGKDRKSPLQIGKDLTYEGNEGYAFAIRRAIKRELLAMEALYGENVASLSTRRQP